jgi:hypothetical protein
LVLVSGLLGGLNIVGVVQGLVLGLLGAIALVVYVVFYALAWLFAMVFRVEPMQSRPPEPADAFSIRGRFGATPTPLPSGSGTGLWVPDELWTASTFVALVLVVLVVVWLLSRGLRRTLPAKEAEGEERESLGSWDMLRQQVLQWLDRLLKRLRPARTTGPEKEEDDLSVLQGNPEWSGTLSVRQIYIRLQRLAAMMGYPRSPQQTPVEYLEVLASAMPELRAELASITAAYIEARYGPAPVSAVSVLAANNAWKRVESGLSKPQ